MIKMTKADALRRQAEQIEHYVAQYGAWVREAVAAETTADQLADGEHFVSDINRHIPRGGAIEFIIERRGYKTQASDPWA
jgi:hypothetical protein